MFPVMDPRLVWANAAILQKTQTNPADLIMELEQCTFMVAPQSEIVSNSLVKARAQYWRVLDYRFFRPS